MSFDLQTIAAVIFFILLSIYCYRIQNKLDLHGKFPWFYFSMLRTKLGLEMMDKLAKKYKTIVYVVAITFLATAGIVGFGISQKPIGFTETIYLSLVTIFATCGILLLIKPSKIHQVMIFFGFFGMASICIMLVKALFDMLSKPDAVAGVGLVLPFNIKGAFFVPFAYWIICIFIIALVHEMAHGVVSRMLNIKVKTSGFAFVGTSYLVAGLVIMFFSVKSKVTQVGLNNIITTFSPILNATDFWISVALIFIIISFIKNFQFPIIPAAFVEPDEKVLKKRPHWHQHSVFAAGPFSNIVLALMALILFNTIFVPAYAALNEPSGVILTDFGENSSFADTSIQKNEILLEIDDYKIGSYTNLSNALKEYKPGDDIRAVTDKGTYDITLGNAPENKSQPYLGVFLDQNSKIKEEYASLSILNEVLKWFSGDLYKLSFAGRTGLLEWLFILNLGIGLFNLVPLGPVDGGRMFQLAAHKYFGTKRGNKLWHWVSLIFLGIVVFAIIFSFVQ